jgi:hypothetical protein
MLLMVSFSEAPVTETVDLTEYNPSGGAGTLYRASGYQAVSSTSMSGRIQTVTFQPGEAIAFTFPEGIPGTATNQCDLNNDGTANVIDVQLAINMALGSSPCTASIAAAGVCNVVVVQRVVNAALGGTCVTGS